MIFRPFPRFVAPISAPPPLAIAKVASMIFIQHAALAKLVGDVGQNLARNLVATPGLEAPMHSFVVRIALGSMCRCAPVFKIQSIASRTRSLRRPGRGWAAYGYGDSAGPTGFPTLPRMLSSPDSLPNIGGGLSRGLGQ
jgi:hypothetical protein